MKIENTAYYEKSTEFFRQKPYVGRTEFGEEGLTYIGNDFAIALRRASKSNYEVIVIYGGDVAVVVKHNLADAAAFAAATVQRAEG